MLRVTGSMTFYRPNSQPTYFNQLKQTVTHAGHDSSKLKPLRPGIPIFKLRYRYPGKQGTTTKHKLLYINIYVHMYIYIYRHTLPKQCFFPDFNDPSRACDFDLTHHIASLSPADHTSRANMSYVASCRLSVSQSWRWPRARSTHPGTKWTFIIDRIECWCVWKYWSIVLYILDTEPPNKTSKLAEAYIYILWL